MTGNIIFEKLKSSIGITFLIYILGLTGCNRDNFYEDNYGKDGIYSLEFNATVFDGKNSATRALTQNPVIVQANDFPGKFYIETYAPDFIQTSEQPNPQFGTYIVPTDGSGGMLSYEGAIDDPQKPNWCNIEDEHFFWSWTVPWMDPTKNENNGGDTGGDNGDDNGGSRSVKSRQVIPGSKATTDSYTPSRDPIRLKLQNTNVNEFNFDDSTWNADSWGNGRILETLVSAKSGPYNFRQNGPEVPLQFRHLVSKISLRSLTFYAAAGNKLEDLKANITFINMPTDFVLYPHPTQQDVDANPDCPYIKADGPPIAVTDFNTASPTSGLTFAFTNPTPDKDLDQDGNTPYRDKFYICPEIDFSKVQFMVEMYDEKYMSRGEYWGDFSTVVFEREPGTDYDNDNVTDSNGDPIDDSTILHAGEIMYFDLIVRESGGGGYRIYVRNWDTGTASETKHYPHPGIYTKGEADDLAGTASDQWQSKFELYGDGFTDGEKEPAEPQLPNHIGIFHMYQDITRNTNTFPIGPGYVLNGMGYTLEFNPSSETSSITIGNMVDIYLKLGENTIYIDENGYIFQYDPSTNKYSTTNSRIDITDNKNSYTINMKTGEIT